MVLEPLSAFSVACNIIQVVEVGCKVIAGAVERYRSGNELLGEHRELRDISRTIQHLNINLQTSLFPNQNSGTLSPQEVRLQEANEECLRLSKDFIEFLNRLQVKNRHALLQSFKMSIKAYWFRDKIQGMQKALSQARENLNFAFVLYMNSQQLANAHKTQEMINVSSHELAEVIQTAMKSSGETIRREICSLADDLKETYLDCEAPTIHDFLSQHQDSLRMITEKLQSISLSHEIDQVHASELRDLTAQQTILDTLSFPQIHHRFEQVPQAQHSTYNWMLKPLSRMHHWTCFHTWLQTPDNPRRIYWIHGKPGSGKSTLSKFLYQNLDESIHMQPWCGPLPLYKAQFFFWNTGVALQKSLAGFYRSLLFDLLHQRPELTHHVITPKRWRVAQFSAFRVAQWTELELRQSLLQTIQLLCTHAKVFLVIDGLDELEGTGEEQDQLVGFLVAIGQVTNLKACISSRPWNIFRDALGHDTQLRLEDLTSPDIEMYIVSQFERSPRWKNFGINFPQETQALVTKIIKKASGVFLWVRLVMRDMIQGIRDGDSLSQISVKLDRLPGDLNEYFMRIVNSILPQYRREASIMLQLACYHEPNFATLHPLRLLDLSFVEEFAIESSYDFTSLDFVDSNQLSFRLDSTLRKLNSRCMGLLECSDGKPEHQTTRTIARLEGVDITDAGHIFDLEVNFIHRSLREFLTQPDMQQFLNGHTAGPLNIRRFFCNIRLVQFVALLSLDYGFLYSVGIASYLLSALSVEGTTHYANAMFQVMQDGLQKLAERNEYGSDNDHWYIMYSLEPWASEQSNCLSLAIDFGITSFVLENLNPDAIKYKRGRPILDYILRPRFSIGFNIGCCYRWPDLNVVQLALSCGANPNELYNTRDTVRPFTIWERFLALWMDVLAEDMQYYSPAGNPGKHLAFFETMKLLIRAGAPSIVSPDISLMYDVADGASPASERAIGTVSGISCDVLSPVVLSNGAATSRFCGVSTLLLPYEQFFPPGYYSFLAELKCLEDDQMKSRATGIDDNMRSECHRRI